MHTFRGAALVGRAGVQVGDRHAVAHGRVVAVVPVRLGDAVHAAVAGVAKLRRFVARVTVGVGADPRHQTELVAAAVDALVRLGAAQPLHAGRVSRAAQRCQQQQARAQITSVWNVRMSCSYERSGNEMWQFQSSYTA